MPRTPPIPSRILSDPRRLEAARLIASGARLDMTWEEIADRVGISRRSLQEWRKEEDFQEAVRVFAMGRLEEKVPDVFERIYRILRKGSDRDALRAAELMAKAVGLLVERREDISAPLDTESLAAALDRLFDAQPAAAPEPAEEPR